MSCSSCIATVKTWKTCWDNHTNEVFDLLNIQVFRHLCKTAVRSRGMCSRVAAQELFELALVHLIKYMLVGVHSISWFF